MSTVRLIAGTVLGLALLPLSRPAIADPIEEKNVIAGKTKIDSAKGYIFVSGAERQFGTFLRVPDDETRATWQKDWDKAFAKAQKRYVSALAQWQADLKIAEQTKSRPRDKPEEPTRETFTIDPLDLRDAVNFGPMFVYAKGDRFSYLNSVKPGTYIWYGPLLVLPAGASGTCWCMGTVRFEVKQGVLTNLGNVLWTRPHFADQRDITLQLGGAKIAERAQAARAEVAAGGTHTDLPATLKDWPAEVPVLQAAGKLNNYYGGMVSRLPAVDGVLAYKRDRVIDVPTGEEVPNGPLVSRQKIKK
jgi:hypothetical protein